MALHNALRCTQPLIDKELKKKAGLHNQSLP